MDKKRFIRSNVWFLPLLAVFSAASGRAETNTCGQNFRHDASYATLATDDSDGSDETSTESQTTADYKFYMKIAKGATGTVAASENLELSDQATITGGKVTLINTTSKDWNPFSEGRITNLNDKGKNYLKIDLNKALAEKDIIQFTGSKKFYIAKSADSETNKITVTNKTYTVTSEDELSGTTVLYVWLNAKKDSISSISISTPTEITASFPDETSVSGQVGDEDIDLPTLTVKAGETTLTAGTDYKVTYSFGEKIAEVTSEGKLTFLKAGETTVKATITPTNSAKYTSATATFSLTVTEDPTTYKVTAETKGTKHTTLKTSDGNLLVTLGGWMFNGKTSVTNGTTNEQLGAGDWGGIESKSKLTGYSHFVAEGDNKNARQEDGSNAQPQSTKLYNGSLEEATKAGALVDPMFNVPASGSFLTFAPKTNGKVKAVIFQSGVFDTTNDSGSTVYVYRPQRRTFIVDEAGKYVPSKAELTDKDNKFNPGNSYDITNYTWDLDKGEDGKGKTPTVEDVKNHFVNLTNFEFTSSQANGVYESNLDYDKVKNELIKDGTESLPDGARGWCVLSDAAVTYTFDVKAGKTYHLYNFGSRIGLYGFTMTAAENITEDGVEYKEEEQNNITKTPEGHVAKVKLDRVFKGGVWNAAVLPFSLNKQQVDAIFGTTYGNGNNEENSTQILYFDHIEGGSKAVFMRHAYNTIVAGKPFLIKPQNTGDITIDTENVKDFPYVTIEGEPTPADWCAGNGYVWKSSYNPVDVKNGEYFIGGTDGKFYRWTGEKPVLAKGFRGYLALTSPDSSAKPALHVGIMSTEGDDNNTTLIEGITIDSDGNINAAPIHGKVYNINGQVVASDASSLSSLPQGIYIVNGKKYVK